MIRDAILDRLEQLGWSKYRLAKAMRGHIAESVVYGFLAGEFDTATKNADLMLAAVGIDMRTKGKLREPVRKNVTKLEPRAK